MTRLLALLLALFLPVSAMAQSFAPVAKVNDRVISGFELEQRTRFLTLLRAPGDVGKLALDGLIEERLKFDAAKAAGIKVTGEQIQAGMAEFAGRVNMPVEQLLPLLNQSGVETESFRDFVAAGVVWRELVRAKFGATTKLSDAELKRALDVTGRRSEVDRVQLSELVMPATGPGSEGKVALAAKLAAEIKSPADFARLASVHSVTPSKANGGKLGWIPLESLPPEVRRVVLSLKKDVVSAPVRMGGGIALFMLHARDVGSKGAQTAKWLEYIAPDTATAQRLKASLRDCSGLYKEARGKPAAALVEGSGNPAQASVAAALAGLDVNEVAIASRGGFPLVVMLCERSLAGADPELAPSKELFADDLFNGRLGGLADGYLADLKANAIITLY